jgi:aminopeptidase YwaD
MTEIKITAADVRDALAFTGRVIDECGARLAGGASCKKAAQIIMSEMKKYCDCVQIEEFDVHPESFLGFFKITVIIYLLSSLLLFFDYILAGAIGFLLIIFLVISKSIFYWEIFDFFYRKMQGCNVIGSIEPAGFVKQQIILSAHHDSAYEFRFLARHQELYPLRILTAFLTLITVFILSWIWVYSRYTGGPDPAFGLYFRYAVFAGLIFVGPMYFFITKKGTPGAGDNMIATAMVIKLAELFQKASQKNGHLLRHTRLIILSTDAEEAGLRGARAYVQRHSKELRALPTYDFNIDSIYNLKELKFFTTDINSLVRLSKEMAAQCGAIAANLGYPVRLIHFPPGAGGTDAAEFAKIGVEATTLIAMPTKLHGNKIVYHTLQDTVEHIEPAAVEATLKIALGYILRKEEEAE